jgi:hypothetical protein
MKKFIGAVVGVCVMGLTACGAGSGTATDENGDAISSITINKDGSISNSIVEDFGESYYDEASLKTMIEDSISEYINKSSDMNIDKPSLKSCKVADGYANVTIDYESYKAYAGFNGEDLFVGTVAEANLAGYDLNVTLKDVAETSNTISKPQLLSMGDSHIVIWEAVALAEGEEPETVRINCYDDILYVGDGVASVGKKSADVTISDGYGIIVFK